MAILRGDNLDNKYLFSDNTKVLATALNKAIDNDKQSINKDKAKTGVNYYNYEHDILKNRIFYIDDNDVLHEDKTPQTLRFHMLFH